MLCMSPCTFTQPSGTFRSGDVGHGEGRLGVNHDDRCDQVVGGEVQAAGEAVEIVIVGHEDLAARRFG